jgi:sulfoxide reductase heme-binding subunit YedZ
VTSLAVWYLMRGSGVVALLLLSGAAALGVATWGRVTIGSLPRFATPALHRSVSLLAVAFTAVHVTTSVADPWAPVRPIAALVPFAASAHALPIGLGAVAVDLLAAVAITGVLRARIGARAFRAVHWAAYAAWPVAVVHGLGLGSDVGTAWFRALTVSAVALVGAAVAWRASTVRRDRLTAAVR